MRLTFFLVLYMDTEKISKKHKFSFQCAYGVEEKIVLCSGSKLMQAEKCGCFYLNRLCRTINNLPTLQLKCIQTKPYTALFFV